MHSKGVLCPRLFSIHNELTGNNNSLVRRVEDCDRLMDEAADDPDGFETDLAT
jgi:hypothetical protein